jgi:branched-chain amino acid transport system substrate-binding protein
MKAKYFMMITVSVCVFLIAPSFTSAKAPKPIKIGVLGPMGYDFGELIWYGADMAAKVIDGEGGINVGGAKRPVKLIKINTNEMKSITDAIAAVDKALMIDKVDCLIGGFRTEAVLAMQDRAMDEKVIFIGSGSAAPVQNVRVKKNYDKYKYWFRVNMNVATTLPFFFAHLNHVANTLKGELGLKKIKVAILADKAAYADPAVAGFQKAVPKYGHEVVEVIRVSPVASDVTAEMTAIKASGAHIVMQMLTGPAGAIVARKWGELKIPTVLTTINVLAQSKALWKATGGKGEYVTTATAFARYGATPSTISFHDRFEKKYGEFPGHGAMSHEAIMIYKGAVEKAGTLDSDKLVPALEKTDYTGAAYRFVFRGMDDPFPHDVKTGPGYAIAPMVQWVKGEQLAVWPPKSWEGQTFKGVHKFQIPPWMAKHYGK